jgi:hypothetical protein
VYPVVELLNFISRPSKLSLPAESVLADIFRIKSVNVAGMAVKEIEA